MRKFKVVELFSGIGSQVRALENIGIECEVQATCERDIHAFTAYDAIHKETNILPEISKMTKEEVLQQLKKYTLSNDGKKPMLSRTLQTYSVEVLRRILTAIIRTNNLIDISEVKGEDMPKNTDLLTYSFPCQDVSNANMYNGYNKGNKILDKNSGSRSSLLWEVGRILYEMKDNGLVLPKYLVMENVPALLSNRHFNNFQLWIKELEDLGYESKYVRVNARNYGIPQNRTRLLMLSVFVGDNKEKQKLVKSFFDKWGNNENYIVDTFHNSKYFKQLNVADCLRVSSDKTSTLWKEEISCNPNDNIYTRKMWENNPKIIDEDGKITSKNYIGTITTAQYRHPNSGNIYFNCGVKGKSNFRYLTPRECLLFMGFTDKDYDRLQENNPTQRKSTLFTRDKIIHMAGNSIPVQMLEGFFFQLYDLDKILIYE